jgi:hypothetical protein
MMSRLDEALQKERFGFGSLFGEDAPREQQRAYGCIQQGEREQTHVAALLGPNLRILRSFIAKPICSIGALPLYILRP